LELPCTEPLPIWVWRTGIRGCTRKAEGAEGRERKKKRRRGGKGKKKRLSGSLRIPFFTPLFHFSVQGNSNLSWVTTAAGRGTRKERGEEEGKRGGREEGKKREKNNFNHARQLTTLGHIYFSSRHNR